MSFSPDGPWGGTCGGKLDAVGRAGTQELDARGKRQSRAKVAAMLSIVESCRRREVPLRDYLLAVLPGPDGPSFQKSRDSRRRTGRRGVSDPGLAVAYVSPNLFSGIGQLAVRTAVRIR